MPNGQLYVEGALHPAILVDPGPAHIFDDEDFSSLVGELIHATDIMADRVQIRRGYMYGGVASTDWTWVNFILDEAAVAAIGSIVAALVAWGRNWIKKARRRDPHTPPVKACIYGPTGKVLREVEIPPEK